MSRAAILVNLLIYLAACSQASDLPTGTLTPASQTPTRTIAPSLTHIPTETPAASITPPSILPVAIHPLALNETNAGMQMQRLAVFGTGEPNDLAWSPDGSLFAVATSRGVWLYDGSTLEETGFIDVNDSVSALAFSPDGTILALAVDGNVGLWSVDSGQMIKDLESDLIHIFELAYGRGGQIAALGWVVWTDDGNYDMVVWDGTSGQKILIEDNIHDLLGPAFSADGTLLVFGSARGPRVVDARSGSLIADAPEMEHPPILALFSQDGARVFLMTGGDSENRIWDLAQSQLLPWHACIFPMAGGDDVLICGSEGHTTSVVDLVDGQVIAQIDYRLRWGPSALRPDGTSFAVLDGWGDVKILDTRDASLIATLPFTIFANNQEMQVVAVGRAAVDGKNAHLVATANRRGDISIWDLQTGEIVRMLEADVGISGLAFSPDQHTLASLNHDGILELWDIQTLEAVYRLDTADSLRAGGGVPGPIVFAPSGTRLAMLGDFDDIYLLDLQAPLLQQVGASHLATGSRAEFMFMPDDRLLSLGEDADVFALIDTISGEVLLPLPDVHTVWWNDSVSEIDADSLSSDGRYFAFGTDHGLIQVWDIEAQRLVSTFAGHPAITTNAYVYSIIKLVFGPQSGLLVSIGRDGTTRLWNIHSGTELRRLNVCCYADFTPDGRYLVTAGAGVIRVWGLPSP